MSIADGLSTFFLVIGVGLMLVAAIGFTRMPDLFIRMSAATKASTVGAAALLLAAAIHFGGLAITTQVVATIGFLLATAPVGAHVIARAAYRKRHVALYEQTRRDDLGDYYARSRDDFAALEALEDGAESSGSGSVDTDSAR